MSDVTRRIQQSRQQSHDRFRSHMTYSAAICHTTYSVISHKFSSNIMSHNKFSSNIMSHNKFSSNIMSHNKFSSNIMSHNKFSAAVKLNQLYLDTTYPKKKNQGCLHDRLSSHISYDRFNSHVVSHDGFSRHEADKIKGLMAETRNITSNEQND